MKTSLIAFNALFESAVKVDFNPQWANGTGYLDRAVGDTSIDAISCCIDNFGRRVLIIPTGEGDNAVYFERYRNNHEFLTFNAALDRVTYPGHPGRYITKSGYIEGVAESFLLSTARASCIDLTTASQAAA